MLDKKFMKGRDTNMENEEKETAIREGQQLKSKQEIINDIIKILLCNEGMSVYYGKEILREAIDALYKTPIVCK